MLVALVVAIAVGSVAAVSIPSAAACIGGNILSCTGVGVDLLMSAINIHSWNDGQAVAMFGTTCRAGLKGRFSGFTWKWDGRFRCDNYPWTGGATYLSKGSAIEGAFRDWVTQAANAGFFNSPAAIGKK